MYLPCVALMTYCASHRRHHLDFSYFHTIAFPTDPTLSGLKTFEPFKEKMTSCSGTFRMLVASVNSCPRLFAFDNTNAARVFVTVSRID